MGNKQHLIFGTFMLFLLAGTICGANTEFKPVKGTSSLVIHDIPIDKDGLRTVYVRLYDSEKRNAKYFMDVFMKDPTNLSIFTKESTYDPSKPSVFFIHGFIDNPNWHLSALLTTAFLSRGDVNVFNIGWNKLNKPPYTLATNTSKIVGRKLAEFFQLAIDKNYINISDINMIGHSLGAHLAGHISRYLTKRLPVIVGLDPAGPEFDTVLATDKLTEKDADVVHYIQTNRYIFGSEANLGRANYWFNGRAILQPGCWSIFCEDPDNSVEKDGPDTEFKPDKGTITGFALNDDCGSSDVIGSGVCQKVRAVKESFDDILLDKDALLRTVYVRLYDSEKKNAKYFLDVFMKDPTNLSIFSKKSTYDPSKPSVFFIHGFLDDSNFHLSALLATAFLSRGDVNVFNIGWSKLNKPPYTLAVINAKKVGRKLAEFLQLAIDKNYIKTSDINIIGHSLGAHLAGHISRYLTKRLPVIVGLDPAGPEFDSIQVTEKLTEKDADVVHYIQTNRYMFGSEVDLGHANYKFNGRAILQPGCFTPGCSHFRAVVYYSEAVKNPGTFIAIKCESYEQFKENKCQGERSIIGFPVDKRAKGLYFITTNSDEPYGKGEDGVKPDSA